jgi:hypothetical protein
VTTATVVLCPPIPGERPTYDTAAVVVALLASTRGVQALAPVVPAGEPGDDARTTHAHWVAHLAIALGSSGVPAPVLLVVEGSSGGMVAALGFSQRAARRAVSGYVLIDAVVPDIVSDDWPDAPVHYVASPLAPPLEVNQARLRGWTVYDVADTSVPTIAASLATIATR